MHIVDFPTKFQNRRSSGIDSIFVDKSRMGLHVIFHLSIASPDHEVQCIILHKLFLETKVKNGKYENNLKLD
jgi:hypothetical protein